MIEHPPANPETHNATFKRALAEFEDRTHTRFMDQKLLQQVFTRRSFAFGQERPLRHNEGLEYEGDKTLRKALNNIVHGEYERVFEGVDLEKNSEKQQEARKARKQAGRDAMFLGQNIVLSRVALDLGMNLCLRIAAEEARSPALRKHVKILADTIEAYLQGLLHEEGPSAVESFVRTHIAPRLEDMRSLLENDEKMLQRIREVDPEGLLYQDTSEYTVSENNPWVVWGLQGNAIPFYPLKEIGAITKRVREGEIDVTQWTPYSPQEADLRGQNASKLFAKAKEHGLHIRFRMGPRSSRGRTYMAIFVNDVLLGMRADSRIGGLASTAYKRLEAAKWDMGRVEPWRLGPKTETPDDSGESESETE